MPYWKDNSITAERKKDVLDAFLQLLINQGVADTSVRDLSSAINLQSAGMYCYFATKEYLVAAYAEEAAARLEHNLIAAFVKKIVTHDFFLRLKARAAQMAPTMKFYAQVCSAPKYEELLQTSRNRVPNRYEYYATRYAQGIGCPTEEIVSHLYHCVAVVMNYMVFGDNPYIQPQIDLIEYAIVELIAKYKNKKACRITYLSGAASMKMKAKTKDCQLIVRSKLSFGSSINEQELDFFSRKLFRGFFKPKVIKRNVIDFIGPVGISLYDRLRKPISKYDFFFIIEQIVDATQKLQKNGFTWNKVVWDIKYAYMNEATKEVQFLYFPLSEIKQSMGDVREFVESIIYSAQPVGEHDSDFVLRFSYFLRSLDGFDPDKVEEFIKEEDRSIVNTIKKHRANRSGFMTDKRQDYYKHYDGDENGDEPTSLLEDDEATGFLNNDNNETTGLLTDADDEEATGLLNEAHIHYPTLFRVLTEETILINKPVFRIGKERSYVDYFVTNNNAVSRSHADIVTRGSRYFVIDLNSKNKTFINGQMLPIQYETEIFDGDRLKLGNEEFIFYA